MAIIRKRPTMTTTASSALAAAAATADTSMLLDDRKISGDLTPLNNFLLVKVAEAEEQTEGGILLTGKAKIKKTEGTVVAVGPGRTHPYSGVVYTMPVTVGEGVLYGKFDGTEIDLNGAAHTLIRDEDILVKFASGADGLSMDSVDVCNDQVLVFVDKSEKETEGGILIAKSSTSSDAPSTGQVVKVGPGRIAASGDRMPMTVAPGDLIKFRDFAGNEVEIDDQDYTVVRMGDILAKF